MSDQERARQRRLLFVVARGRVDLYDDLRKALLNEPGVEVLLDRRVGERRAGGGAAHERRRVTRRKHTAVDAEIREYGWAVVKTTT